MSEAVHGGAKRKDQSYNSDRLALTFPRGLSRFRRAFFSRAVHFCLAMRCIFTVSLVAVAF